MKKLMSIGEAALVLSVSRTFLFRAAEEGTIPSVKLGRRRMIRAEDLERIVARGCGSRRPSGRGGNGGGPVRP